MAKTIDRKTYNPLNDYLFKFIFGREERKRVTLSLINAILGLENERELTNIHFIDRDIDPIFIDEKLSKLDIYGETNDGSRIDIEIQLVNEKNMEQRTLYYWSRMYFESLKKGDPYDKLHRTITINLLDFNFLPTDGPHHMYGIYDFEGKHRLTEDFEIHFLEFPKFQLTSIKEMKRLEKWMAYFSNKLNDKEMEELAMSEPAIREALKAESVFMQDDIERRKYLQREKAILDYKSAMSSSHESGLQEGKDNQLITDLKNLMRSLNLSPEKALESLNVPEKDWQALKKKL